MNERVTPVEWQDAADLVAVVRDLGKRVLTAEIDERFLAGTDNRNDVDAMVEAGLFGLTLPVRFGGQGRDYTAFAAVSEELGYIDTAHQVSLTVHLGLVSMCILQWGSEQQREQWLPMLAREIGRASCREGG